MSHQASRSDSKTQWKDRVKTASMLVLPEGHWSTSRPISVTLYYFPPVKMQGDVDNIVKLTLDAMSKHIYNDDNQVERVVTQKFEPGNVFTFSSPTPTLSNAITHNKPVLYIKLSDQPFEELK